MEARSATTIAAQVGAAGRSDGGRFAANRTNAWRWTVVRTAFDIAAVAAASAAAVALAGGAGDVLAWAIVFAIGAIVVLRRRDRTSPPADVFDDTRNVVVATTWATMLAVTAEVLIASRRPAVAAVLELWVLTAVATAAGRIALSRARSAARRRGFDLRPTLIVGAGRVARLIADRLLERPELGLRPIGFLDKDPLDDRHPLPILGASWDLEQVVELHHVEEVVIAFSTAPNEVLLNVARRCERLNLAVSIVPRLFERPTAKTPVQQIGGVAMVQARPSDVTSWRFAAKYLVDRVVAALLLLLLAPVFVLAALAVLVSLGRPIFFRQPRVGRGGSEFKMLKFRTMKGDPASCGEADAVWAAEQLDPRSAGAIDAHDFGAANGADRSTAAGNFLRRSSIDELPQLVNVLLGSMSLVGPRPERTSYVRRFEVHVHRYAERHRIKPGITGWAQVHGLRGATSLSDRIEWDNYYIENWSPWLDLKILLMTLLAVPASFRDGDSFAPAPPSRLASRR